MRVYSDAPEGRIRARSLSSVEERGDGPKFSSAISAILIASWSLHSDQIRRSNMKDVAHILVHISSDKNTHINLRQ